MDKVPCREEGLTPYEMMLSESQERMLMVLKPGREAEAEAIFRKWELDFAVIGTVTDTGHMVLEFDGEVVCDIPLGPLADEAPCYERPYVSQDDYKAWAGIKPLGVKRRYVRVIKPVRVDHGASWAEFLPYDGTRFEVEIDFDTPLIGRQSWKGDLNAVSFKNELSRARTFGFMRDVERLWAMGLALGSSLENSVVIGDDNRVVNMEGLRARYERLIASNPDEVSKDSPLKHGRRTLPRYFSTKDISVSDLNIGVLQDAGGGDDAAKTTSLVSTLNVEGWWPTPLVSTSRRYIGDGSPIPAPGDYSQTEVGDETDTSPFKTADPRIGISTGTYIANMATMIRFLNA